MSEDKKKNMLDQFLKNASVEDMEELYRLLDERDKKKPSFGMNGKLDLDSVAKNMSRQIQEQLGMSSLNIKKMATDLVVQLARQHQPNISDKELSVIINQMVPGSSAIAKELPPELLMTMVEQFIATDIKSGGEWKKRYWEVFPDEIKTGIAGYLSGDIGKNELMRITSAFNAPKKEDKKEKKRRGMPIPPGPRRNPY